jgi:hypothetical protein
MMMICEINEFISVHERNKSEIEKNIIHRENETLHVFDIFFPRTIPEKNVVVLSNPQLDIGDLHVISESA